jgi:DNA polymerase III epsilon subunit-like protein
MKLLIFDTETTGLPLNKRQSALSKRNNWPHIVSISWVIMDTNTSEIVKTNNHIIKPLGWTIPEEATNIHGITHETAVETGEDLSKVIRQFMSDPCDMIVAHNSEFDMNVLVNAIVWDLGMEPPSFPKQVCTMKLTTNICKIPGKYRDYKYPSLKELYYHVFRKYPDETRLHGSLYDTLVLCEIVKKFEPLRKEMGLVVSSVDKPHGIQKTIYFNFE